ncbi:indolepyruvate ferredoxin oxidoreductase subunit alpha [Desulfosarcina ovata]|uniref:Indolepyruvate oxidoreductase subunit IorA n=1 Tax=Desulfosarcina ovata subsp. ovata TaxID=2752305 RepID=A0A5K8A7V9_9BACT|nr:indolepyruvate ferredoxin oxidoreductase subunit alpha [Desulfosarcina ovata]BBO88625.1 indolepyruvate oxidoreductase [Desulfosarcina ovata subsp. ovata]
MKKMGTMLLRREPFSEIVMGNTAIVRAMVEAGTRVVTSYPGSPTPEIATAIGAIPTAERPFYFEFSTNEKVATELAYGAALNGHLSTVFFKSVGLNVAADTFVQLSLMNIIGGMVVVLGDDPGANSSQNEQDNRHYAMLSYTPVLEPADPEEVYHYYIEAAGLSRQLKMPVILRLTTHVCHAKQKVAFGAWNPDPPDDTPRFDPANGPYIPLTSMALEQKRMALERLEKVRRHAEKSPLNRQIDNGNAQWGIITMGLPFLSLMEVVHGAATRPDILKLAYVHPLPRQTIVDFLAAHQAVKILEELDDVLETQIKAIAFDESLPVTIIGKTGPSDWVGEYTPDKVRQTLAASWPDLVPAFKAVAIVDPAPPRPAQMCPGCGHRSAFFAIKQALSATDITVADIGCHTLGYQPPYEMGQLLMCMGASTAMGSGLRLFNTQRKVVAFMGDSTFFHAALPGIVNAVFNQHPITLILMENGTTAMTGHQDHAATGHNVNQATDKIPVRQVLEGLGVKHIFEVDTYQQAKLAGLVTEATAIDEFSVVIARHPCMLKFTRGQRRKADYRQQHVEIDQTVCDRLHTCVEHFGCPTFTRDAQGNVTINTDLCIGDGSCIQTCPTKAIAPVGKKGKGGAR